MLENIVRHIESGERVMDAAFRGSREIAFTILSITLSLVAVFIPVLFMGGVVGRVFREFAVTISMTILISGFVSLTLTPMLCSRLLKPHHEGEHHNIFYRAAEGGFNALFGGYRAGLSFVLRWRRAILFLTILSIAASGYLFVVVPKGFFPSEDTGAIVGFTEAAEDISVKAMAEHQLAVSKLLLADPNVADVNAAIGAVNSSPSLNIGRLFIQLKPRDQRQLSADQIIQELRPKLARIPGIDTYLQSLQNINLGGRLAKSAYQYTLQDSDTDELYKYAEIMQERIAKLPGVLRTSIPTFSSTTGSPSSISTATRRRSSASRWSRSRRRSTTRSARARSRPSTSRPTASMSSSRSRRSTRPRRPIFRRSI